MLTAARIRAAEPAARPYKIADGQGLHLHVAPTGRRTFRLGFRFGGKPQLLVIGPFPEVTLAEARDRRDEARAQLRRGEDPRAARRAVRETAALDALTFEVAARAWIAEQREGWSAEHAADVESSLVNHVFPAIGAKPIGAIAAGDVHKLLQRVERAGAIETARRIRTRISAIFAEHVVLGRVAADPAAPVARLLKSRPDVEPQAAEIELEPARAARIALLSAPASAITRCAAELLLLTAVRSAAVRGARWEEFEGIDWEDRASHPISPLWRIPAARMKLSVARKADGRRDHIVPLSTQAVEVLRQARAAAPAGSPFVFGGRRPLGVNAIGDLHAAAGLRGRHSPHGWRAAFSTILNERFPADRRAIDLALAHVAAKKGEKVEAAYNRATHLERRKELMQIWADLIAGEAPIDA